MRERRLLFFGDSFVAGCRDPEGLGWAGRVVADAHRRGITVTHYNLGVCGDTSAQVALRWRNEAARRISSVLDNRVVFSFGAEDSATRDGKARVRVGASVQALSSCLAAAQALGIPAFVVGPPAVGDGRRVERLQELTTAYARTCGEFDVPFAAVVDRLLHSTDWVVEAATGDGVHPRAGGYSELARLVLGAGFNHWLQT